jgi:hypothetical protein
MPVDDPAPDEPETSDLALDVIEVSRGGPYPGGGGVGPDEERPPPPAWLNQQGNGS